MSLKLPVKYVIWAVVAALLVGAAVAGYISCRCDRGAVSGAAGQHRIPPGWEATAKQTTPLLPFVKNKASEVTAEFPPGSKVVVVETPKGETVEIGILPGGQVVTPEGTKATVYEKRGALFALEVRPFIFGGVGLGGAYAGGGVDLVRVWRVHAGAGAAVTYWPRDEARDVDVGAVATTSFNVWRNVDVVAGGGYGTAGTMAFGGVQLAIE